MIQVFDDMIIKESGQPLLTEIKKMVNSIFIGKCDLSFNQILKKLGANTNKRVKFVELIFQEVYLLGIFKVKKIISATEDDEIDRIIKFLD